jgi:hypothetical protein
METEQKIEDIQSAEAPSKEESMDQPAEITNEEPAATIATEGSEPSVTEEPAKAEEVPAESSKAEEVPPEPTKEAEAPRKASHVVEAPRKASHVVEAPKPKEAAPVIVEAPKPSGKGPTEYPKDVTFANLMFHTEGNGELFVKWSTAPLPKALAIFYTSKKIPAFKMKSQSELLNNIAGNRKKFVSGLASFFKEADTYDGHFQVLEVGDAGFGDVWVNIGGKKYGKEPGVVRQVHPGEIVDINSIEALCILPHSCAVFSGVSKLDFMRFLNTGTREGSVWHR